VEYTNIFMNSDFSPRDLHKLDVSSDHGNITPHLKLCSITEENYHHQGLDFDDMSSFFPCEIGDAIQYINLGHRAQAPKIVTVFYSAFFVIPCWY